MSKQEHAAATTQPASTTTSPHPTSHSTSHLSQHSSTPPSPQAAKAGNNRFDHFPPFIYGLHERGGEQHMLSAGRPGWVLELAAIGLDGANTPANFKDLADAGLGVMVRINHGYGSTGTLPTPDRYTDFANACARYVERSQGCHIWIIGNEPNHENERPNGQLILPYEYARAYALCRQAIHAVAGHEQDQVLVTGPAPWNATTTYPGNEKGDWVRYFVDVLAHLPHGGCDGFSLHTYTHTLDKHRITGDFFHTAPGYRHLRNEFRSYQDFMYVIPERFRSLPVLITEANPATRNVGWEPANNVGWVRAAYDEIAAWNQDPTHQPIQALVLYRWPRVADQPEWSITDRPGIIEDFNMALRAKDAAQYQVRLPEPAKPPTVEEPGTTLPKAEQWEGLIVAPLGVNLRTGPSVQDDVIQVLPDETALTVLAELEDWLYVHALEQKGYVSRSFVLRQDAPETLPPSERSFLREEKDLQQTAPAPPDTELLQLNEETATWTEEAVATTWNQFGGLLQLLAERLEIDLTVAVAVLAVESGGRAFSDDGRMLIRFENHIFFEEWGKLDPERFARFLRFKLDQPWQEHQFRPDANQPWRDFHGDQAAEWQVFELVRERLNAGAAYRSVSMGVPQIMGFNCEKIGYKSAEAMFHAFQDSPQAQIIGFFDFVQYELVRLQGLRSGDLLAFAASYNGAGQAPLYAMLIQDAQRAFNRLRQAAQSRANAPGGDAGSQSDGADENAGGSAEDGDENAEDADQSDDTARLPAPQPIGNLAEIDPELYAAWRQHVLDGFDHNKQMFQRLVDAFMGPYYTTVWLYRLTVIIGLAAFVAAVALSVYTGELLFGVVFGGMSVASFLSYFLSRPLRALEENLNLITWLGVIYNSYWTRLVYAMNQETVQEDVSAITDDFVEQIEQLLDKGASLSNDRPGLR